MKPVLTDTARELRKASTDAEKFLWSRLRTKQVAGFKFRRQEQIGRFIVDFVCYEKHLVVEADGGQHAVEREKDAERTAWLNSQGFRVLRFWNHDILTNLQGVMEDIERHLHTPSGPATPLPSPLPQRGEGMSE